MDDEIWKEIPNYPDYLVSNMGNVLSIRRGKKILLKPHIDRHRNGTTLHRRVVLYPSHGKRRNFRVHELVMLAFTGHTPKGKVIVYENGDTLDDRLENLIFTDHIFRVHPYVEKLKQIYQSRE